MAISAPTYVTPFHWFIKRADHNFLLFALNLAASYNAAVRITSPTPNMTHLQSFHGEKLITLAEAAADFGGIEIPISTVRKYAYLRLCKVD